MSISDIPKLTPPKLGFLGPEQEAISEAEKIIEKGGIAWVKAEYADEMGHSQVFQGHRVYYFLDEPEVVPEWVEFDYYLHDTAEGYEREEILSTRIGFEISEELIQNIGRPFEEVKLHCRLNTQTGKVELIEAFL